LQHVERSWFKRPDFCTEEEGGRAEDVNCFHSDQEKMREFAAPVNSLSDSLFWKPYLLALRFLVDHNQSPFPAAPPSKGGDPEQFMDPND